MQGTTRRYRLTQPDTTSTHEALRDYLRWTTQFRRDNPGVCPPADWKHLCMEDLVLAEGRDYAPAPRPDDVPLGTVKECFKNATELTMGRADLTYVEGYATSAGLGMAVHHAWCATEDGTVIDNTWAEPGTAYVGIPVSAEDHYLAMHKYELWGVLDLWESDFPAIRLGWDGFLASLHEEVAG